jgi:hypothetical protein
MPFAGEIRSVRHSSKLGGNHDGYLWAGDENSFDGVEEAHSKERSISH